MARKLTPQIFFRYIQFLSNSFSWLHRGPERNWPGDDRGSWTRSRGRRSSADLAIGDSEAQGASWDGHPMSCSKK